MGDLKILQDYLDSQSQKKLIVSVIILIAVIIFSFFIHQYQIVLHEVKATVEVINGLYLDESKTYLNPKLTDDMIVDAYAQAKAVSGYQGKYLESLVEDVDTKYHAVQELSRLYQDDHLIIEGDKIHHSMPLKEEVQQADVVRLRQSIPPKDDPFYKTLRREYDQIDNVFSSLGKVSNSIKQLPQDYYFASLKEDIESYHAVETTLEEIEMHPQSENVVDQLHEKGEQFGQKLILHMEDLVNNPDIIDAIFKTESIANPLTGTPVDPRPLVALTFDDGPCQNTLEIMKVLDHYNIKATFFQVGRFIEEYPEITAQVSHAGHTIGNHSYSHANFDELSASEIQSEINKTQDLVTEITGSEPMYYRTPYGNGRRQMMKLYPGLEPIFWNVDSEDWLSDDTTTTVDHILTTLHHRSIILMHDSHESTTEAIKQLIPELIDQGYIFVSPGQIPEADNYRL